MTGSALEDGGNSDMFGNYFSLYMKSLTGSITDWENTFYVQLMYVTICDLHGQRRSQVMLRNERLYMSSYL